MSNIRSKTDEELWEFVQKSVSQTAGGTAQSQQEKQLHLGLTELTLRSQKATREAINTLNESINALNTSSKRYARILVFLTWVLVALTVVMVVPALKSLGILNYYASSWSNPPITLKCRLH